MLKELLTVVADIRAIPTAPIILLEPWDQGCCNIGSNSLLSPRISGVRALHQVGFSSGLVLVPGRR